MFLKMEDGVAILLTFVALLVTIGVGFLIFLLIKRNIAREKEESEIIAEDALSKRQMVDSINNYIKKVDKFGAFALIYVDLDGFGEFNELFDTVTCDNILKEAALRMLRVLPNKASLCRFQNDEFMIFVKDEDNKTRIERLANQIKEVINQPYKVMIGDVITMSASIGIASYPIAGERFEDLYNNLLLTTYVSKRDGGNKYTNYYSSISQEETDNMSFFIEVKNAIAHGEYVLYYQPIIDMRNNVIVGCECLMRWNHPTKGVLPPNTFLSVLEQSGDIKWVGGWGLDQMIKLQAELQNKYAELPLTFSLNLSTKQLLDPYLANNFIERVNKANAKPSNFMLEISDFMVLEKIPVIRTNIYKLRDFGFKIAVDGFELDGVSVQNIQRIPIDVIKLGRNFLKTIENNYIKEKLLEIINKYALDNNKLVISEGVENAEVASYVMKHEVHVEQGYFFSKPISEEEFVDYIDQRKYKQMINDVHMIDSENMIKAVEEAIQAKETEAKEVEPEAKPEEAEVKAEEPAEAATEEVVEEASEEKVEAAEVEETKEKEAPKPAVKKTATKTVAKTTTKKKTTKE